VARRRVLAAFGTLGALVALGAAVPGASAVGTGAGGVPRDALTVVVSDASGARGGAPMTYELRCAPTGGTHPDAAAACSRLDEVAGEGRDPFSPVPSDRMCTQIYGGPATAHITGSWRGRAVDATFDRRNGCEIARWRDLVPVLPALA
jgi:hypothetical protein